MTSVIAVEWSQGIEDAWSDVASFVPKFLGFSVILIVGHFVAKTISQQRADQTRALQDSGEGGATSSH